MASKKGEKKQHIQVFTRVRPLNSQELRSQVVVDCINSKDVTVRDKSQTKTFTFDRVFGPDSKQVDVYKAVVNPLIPDVLQGYSCTVFAYGQTGTGKTFTMVGEKSQDRNKSWEDDPSCGIIPRTLSHLFNELKIRGEEFTVRVSFLELYNEELCDLLASNDTDDGKSLRLFEDSTKKGSVIVSGLQERLVCNKDDVYTILEAGNLRRQTAPTLMNAQSSRSHTIFTIIVLVKVPTPEGEDLIRTGKLNLVDLAGSENIGRSGAIDIRAREAGNINQSLLTLGRVITALVERAPHVPYRESKLTRILQDSLGGRTKTSIIATVSPALCNIEETLSTFDYAHRARNITNKPEINQKTLQRVFLKELAEENERLRRELNCTREKNGVYMTLEDYNSLVSGKENSDKELVAQLQATKIKDDKIAELERDLKGCLSQINELERENNELWKTAGEAVEDTGRLHDRLDRSKRIQEHNIRCTERFQDNYCNKLEDMKNRTTKFIPTATDAINNEVATHNELLKKSSESETALMESANKFNERANDLFEEMFRICRNQVNLSKTFSNDQIDTLRFAEEKEKIAIEDLSMQSKNSVDKMASKFASLTENLETDKRKLQQENLNLLEVQEKLQEIREMIRSMRELHSKEIEEKNRLLKIYEEKCESLEKRQSEKAKAQQEISSRTVELLKLISNQSKSNEDDDKNWSTFVTEMKEKNFPDPNVYDEETHAAENAAVEIEQMAENVAQSIAEIVEKSETVIKPLVKNISETQSEISEHLTRTTESNFKNHRDTIQTMIVCFKNQIDKANQFMNELEEHSGQIKTLEEVEWEINHQATQHLDTTKQMLTSSNIRLQNLSSKITEHSEKIFSDIHHRLKEIKEFLAAEIKLDEKTGNTPQRKEFSFPKRNGLSDKNRNDLQPLLQIENKENIPS